MCGDRVEAGRARLPAAGHPPRGRWPVIAVVVGLMLSAAPWPLGAAAPIPGCEASTVALASVPELRYARVPAWPPGSRAPRSGTRWTAVYLGDSISVTTADVLRAALPGWAVIARAFGGTAPCDWARPELADVFATVRPDVVVFSFIGNSMTACTGGRTGTALLDSYRLDLVRICLAAAPARCVAVGQPTLGAAVGRTLPGPDEPTSMYRHHAFLGHWGFVDAGAATETGSGAFDQSMRDPDGVHLSESGAGAYAGAIAAYLRLVTAPPATFN